MTVYLAPLEGVTDAVFRRVHRDCFSGVAKYFIPFVSPTQNLTFTARDLSILAPENGFGVPQLLCKGCGALPLGGAGAGDMGYGEVNLNLGCPSGTVTAKGRARGCWRTCPRSSGCWTGFCSRRSPSRRASAPHRPDEFVPPAGRVRALSHPRAHHPPRTRVGF